MEIMDVLLWLKSNHELATRGMTYSIIPTVLIPLSALTVLITSLAGIVASWFGVKLHTEGPKQFLEVLLKKRVIISMLLVNFLCYAGYKGYIYTKNLPRFVYTISKHSDREAIPSLENYTEEWFRPFSYSGIIGEKKFTNLKLVQEVKLPKGAFRSGLVTNESLFYGVDDGYAYEINKKDLSVKRRFYVGTQITTRPIIYKNHLYIGEGNHDTHHARIYKFDLSTGNFVSSFTTKGHTEGQPVIGKFNGKSLLFVAAGSDGIYAINPDTMQEVWHRKDGHLDASVAIEDGVVYVGYGVEKFGSKEKSFAFAYEFNTGKDIWKKDLSISTWMHPVITSSEVCYVLGEIYSASNIGMLNCFDKKTGSVGQSYLYDWPIASKPFYIKDQHNNEFVYFSDFNGNVHAVNLSLKKKAWDTNLGTKKTNYALSSLDFDHERGVLYYPSLDQGIFVLDYNTGKVIQKIQPKDWSKNYAAVSIGGSSLFSMDIKGHLRKFQIE